MALHSTLSTLKSYPLPLLRFTLPPLRFTLPPLRGAALPDEKLCGAAFAIILLERVPSQQVLSALPVLQFPSQIFRRGIIARHPRADFQIEVGRLWLAYLRTYFARFTFWILERI